MAFTNTPFVDGQIISEADLKDRIDNFEKYVNGGLFRATRLENCRGVVDSRLRKGCALNGEASAEKTAFQICGQLN